MSGKTRGHRKEGAALLKSSHTLQEEGNRLFLPTRIATSSYANVILSRNDFGQSYIDALPLRRRPIEVAAVRRSLAHKALTAEALHASHAVNNDTTENTAQRARW